jgi:hypothetical protein
VVARGATRGSRSVRDVRSPWPQAIKEELNEDLEPKPMDTEEEAEMVPAEVSAPCLTGPAGNGRVGAQLRWAHVCPRPQRKAN